MAMHIHSSFSEQNGSMHGQLYQAQQNGVDVLWWTDHDYRMSAHKFRQAVHFDSLTDEKENGRPWTWRPERIGSLTSDSGGGIVSAPASPLDSHAPASLRVSAHSVGSPPASFQFFADSHPADWNYQTNVTGQTLRIEVFPVQIGPDAYLELRIATSWHPAAGGRPAGTYELSYRFGGSGKADSRVPAGLLGVVTIPVTQGQWNSAAITPAADIAALWPDLDSRDFATWQIRLGATSRSGAVAAGNFDYLRFTRTNTSGQVPLQTQRDMAAAYAATFPGVAQRQGLEVSWQRHLNWFGGSVELPNYAGVPRSSDSYVTSLVNLVHSRGGVASYNHPFGASMGPPLPSAQQDAVRAKVATAMLQSGAYGMDMLEVGYRRRSRIDLRRHLSLWDVCSRNALFLTGNGTSDDHEGTDWVNRTNNFLTFAWATSTAEADLLAAMRGGRLYAGTIDGFRGALDLLVDGTCPMGSVSVSQLPRRNLRVIGNGIPTGGGVRVAQGFVDYAGASRPSDNTVTIGTLSEGDLATGSADLLVDTSVSSFVRAEVQDAAGNVVGVSNPAWLLRDVPPGGVPPARSC